jgi:pyridoxal phosphate enzyme (YggS family)
VLGVGDNLELVHRAISRAAEKIGADRGAVLLIAVSKKQSVVAMREYIQAANSLGIPVVFGENYIQELRDKRAEFGSDVEFHLIGPLQSNKTREAVRLADVIQSVHSLKILELIAKEAQIAGKRQRIFLQVNIGEDPNKSGFSAEHLGDVFDAVKRHRDTLSVEGLMTITPFYDQPEMARPDFRAMSALRSRLIDDGFHHQFADSKILLSMGMSADFEIAIEEGANLARVGTAIFGERS